MKKPWLIGFAFSFFLLPSTILACTCAYQPPAYAFNDAKVVFIGRMLGGTEKISVKDDAGKPFTVEAGQVRFSVEEIFKGSNAAELTIQIDSYERTSCGPYGLRRGERYIVYAYASNADEKVLYTGACSRTGHASGQFEKEDLDFLRNLPPPGTGGELYGRIGADLKDSNGPAMLSDVRVTISGADDQTITVFSDEKGEFTAKQLKPGKYKVEIELPPNYTTEKKSVHVMVDDRGAAEVRFGLHIDGKVTGRVFDKDGNNYNSIALKLVNEGKTVYGHSTGDDGVFEIKGAPPGEYFLTLEMQGPEFDKNKSYYYPGTFERDKAAKIRVGLGERIDGLEFRLPAGYLVRTIEGVVVWGDGAPATNVDVRLLCQRSTTPDGVVVEFMPPTTRTDNDGRFRLEGFTGETYRIEARGEKAGNVKHSRSRKFSMNQDIKNLKLMLSKDGYSANSCR